YEGSVLELRHENPQHGGRDKDKLSFTTGFSTSFGETVLVLEYAEDEMLRSGQRDLTAGRGPDGTANYSSTSAYIRDRNKVYHKDDYVMATEQQCSDLFGEYGIWNPAESRYKCRYNTFADDGMQTAKEEYNLVLNHQAELSSDWTLNALLQASDKTTNRGNAQKSISPTIYMDRTNPGSYSYDAADFASRREFRVYRRLDDYGQTRDYTGDQQSLTSSLGLTGAIGDYQLELSWAYGKSTFGRIGRNQMLADKLLEVISFNPADSANPDKWYPLDKMTQAQQDKLYAETLTDAGSGLNQLSAVLTGDLFELPAGTVQFANSIEWAREWYFDLKDVNTTSGNLLGQGGTQGRGERKRYAAATEFAVPLLGSDSSIGSLEMSAALRYDYYDDRSDVGGAATPQIGFKYQPTNDVLVRLNVGRSFRAPDIHRMYAGVSRSFSDTSLQIDPAHPVGLTDSFESISAGNMALVEEKGKFANLGVVAQITDDLSASIDFWRVSLEGAVYSQSSTRILENPIYNMTDKAKNCNELDGIGYIMQQQVGQDYKDVFCVRSGTINSAYEASQGIDAELTYKVNLGDYGSLKVTPKLSYTAKKEYQAYAENPRIEETKDDYLPTWKSEFSVRWNKEDFSVNLSWYYLGTGEGEHDWTLTDATGEDYQEKVWSKLSPFERVNLNSSYRINKHNKLTLGVNNLTDSMPPLFDPGHPSRNKHPYFSENSGYNLVGRTFYASYQYSF
ncbi:MAG: TonB-dependent receptor, partial [Gammaproteobacteria bacterium]|nr:TonB-dependent receptor [Gammaproteobacteria bacterium]